ncbi:hypothetical protein KKD19_02045 [Patescibacteria group bacterium]|nr:hypothetical protein [Patescibacteria group bacterium]MBU4512006.1 hypothetical protein [Patescibacteria group bacterium]MCG2692846.1 hypothetical protein [Candidatus Parcubacteria bacterium]
MKAYQAKINKLSGTDLHEVRGKDFDFYSIKKSSGNQNADLMCGRPILKKIKYF